MLNQLRYPQKTLAVYCSIMARELRLQVWFLGKTLVVPLSMAPNLNSLNICPAETLTVQALSNLTQVWVEGRGPQWFTQRASEGEYSQLLMRNFKSTLYPALQALSGTQQEIFIHALIVSQKVTACLDSTDVQLLCSFHHICFLNIVVVGKRSFRYYITVQNEQSHRILLGLNPKCI